ncbi:hypothetical protein ACLIBG_07520 [Virgibacillus sp. W0181]|uniref:hypothetical protein n=1 Tax=Virgibacillus sp. W0181 TaxID=3391581 RepID=UPI003F471A29
MSVQNNNEDHQAAKLQQLFAEINHEGTKDEPNEPENNGSNKDDDAQDMIDKVDILNLPPRSEIHGSKNKNTRIKFKMPFIRIVAVIILLIIVSGLAYYMYLNELLIFTIFS